MVRSQLYRECTEQLDRAGIPDSRFDVLCIFQDMLGEKEPMFRPNEEVAGVDELRIRELVDRRCQGDPLQYLLGEWEFYGFPMKVGEGVLIPRPDTETLIENVLSLVRRKSMKAPKIADLCSGSGCIAIALKRLIPSAEVYAVELSEKALGYLRANVKLNSADVHIIQGDILSEETAGGLPELDIIVSNPPYLTAEEMSDLQTEVSHEPEMALAGGEDGLDFYRAMTPLWKKSLRPGGSLFYEFGMGQHGEIEKILAGNGFENIEFTRDAGGIIRTAAAEKPEES